MKDSWAEPDIRDEVVDYVRYWSSRTEIKAGKIVNHIGITRSKYYDWRRRYGWHVLLPVQYIGWLQPQSQKAGIMMKRNLTIIKGLTRTPSVRETEVGTAEV